MKTESTEKQLLRMLLDECNLQDLTDLCEELLGTPICFFFHQGQEGFISSAGFDPAEALLEQQQADRVIAKSKITMPQFFQTVMEQQHLRPFIADPERSGLPGRLLLCVASAGISADGIVSMPEKDRPLESLDHELLVLCARCLALCLHQRRWNMRPVRFRMLMYRLLNGRNINYQEILNEAGAQALPERGHFRLLNLRCLDPQESTSLANLAGQLAYWLKTDWLYDERQSALILFEAADLPPDFDDRLRPLLKMAGCAACLSPEYEMLTETALWRKRSSRLLPLLNAAPGMLLHYDDWLDWGLLSEIALQPAELDCFIPGELRLLRNIDRQEHTSLLSTLIAYFENHCSKKRTALAMALHVNTVSFRLQKIEELTGLRLEAPQTLFTLPAAIRLMQYQEARRGLSAP